MAIFGDHQPKKKYQSNAEQVTDNEKVSRSFDRHCTAWQIGEERRVEELLLPPRRPDNKTREQVAAFEAAEGAENKLECPSLIS